MNYRLGAFGWLSGPTFQANGTANAGLHDQRFALEWVQANIVRTLDPPNLALSRSLTLRLRCTRRNLEETQTG